MFAGISINRRKVPNTIIKGLLTVIAAAILSSFVVFSCTAHAGGLSISNYDAHSCQEHSMTSATETEEPTWLAVLSDPLKKVVLVVAFIAIVFAAKYFIEKKLPVHIVQRTRFLTWLWARSRPFLSEKNFLPYFAPVRDA
ncbi:hypothetical protein IH979_02805 [Patescibacteria group bacterium]|nr:hypothetical protein [Patescibacteria group bacterium]